ncbi:MAG: hypothetical protein QG626_298 [Patescibacteria group bacterium]|jgi:EmrB/QacA subfamily drug resistance transporter|nr:hypothetical protein [Patescibacteria group bacterium]
MSHAPTLHAASTTENSASTLPFVRKWGILVVLSLALAIIILDTTILNVALSSIIQDLDTDIQSLQWVITAYSLTLAALTITGGRMGDIFGRKRMFVFGAFLFAVGSFLASISTTVPMLILGESIIEGIGAALMMPATASLLVSNFKGQERAVAFGIWGGIAGASVALGPVLGGFLATNYSWRWGFRVNLIVVGLLMIGSLLIPRGKEEKQKLSLDLLGVLLSATGMLSLVFGIIESSKYGWFKATEVFSLFGRDIVLPANMSIVPVFMLAGTVILWLFMAWERQREATGKTPLVSMEIFKNRMFTSGIFTSATMALGQTGLIFALPVFLQSVRGLDAYHTGLALLPMSLGLLIISPLSALLGRKIPSKYLINFGLFLNAVAYLILWYTLTVDTTASDLILGLTVYGVGMGFVMSQINNITLSAVPVEQAGEASGVNNTLRQVGSTLGSAIMGAVLVGALGTQLVQGVEKSEVIPEAMKPELAQIVETQSSNVQFGGGAQLDGSLPAALKAEIVVIGHEATVDAAKRTLVFGALFAFLGLFVSMITLPTVKPTPHVKKIALVQSTPAPEPLTTQLVAELISADQKNVAAGGLGLGGAVKKLIAGSTSIKTSVVPSVELPDERTRQAQVLWEKGIGTHLGYTDFSAYLASLPVMPAAFADAHSYFDKPVLVDARVSANALTQLLDVRVKSGSEHETLASLDVAVSAYWMRVHLGDERKGSVAARVISSLREDEVGLTVGEGLALFVQHPNVFAESYFDLLASPHDTKPGTTACLGKWPIQAEIRWRFVHVPEIDCQVVTRERA